MGRLCVVSLWFGIAFIIGNANCRENEVFAFPGCNATLEWSIGSEYAMALAHSMKVFSGKGIQIAEKEGMACKNVTDSSIYCEVRNTSSEEWRFSVVLFNVTQANSGNYTGQIKFGPKEANITTKLIVIDEPQIREARKPILHEPLRIKCTINGESEDQIYYWKLNGTYLNSTERIYTESSNLTFERLTLADKFSTFSCGVCSSINCCIESDTYAADPYYGPNNVTLSLNNSDIYLRVNETVKVICSAKCYPVCTFLWDGYIDSENEELVIDSFNSRMVGVYSCIAKNNNTGVTVKSDPIFLHYVQDASAVSSSLGENGVSPMDGANKDSPLELLGVGLVIVAVSLIIVGVLIYVTHMRKHASRRSSSQTVHKPCAGPSNREIPLDLFRFEKHDRPLPIPAVQESARRMIRRSWYPTINRKSVSLQTCFDHNQTLWNPVQLSLSLQTLIQVSHTIGRRAKSDDSLSKPYFSEKDSWFSMEGPANVSRLEEQYSTVPKNKKVSDDKQSPDGARSLSLNNFRPESFEHEPQEDLYSTIDETIWSVYDYARADNQEDNRQNNHRSTGAGNYEYDYATLPHL